MRNNYILGLILGIVAFPAVSLAQVADGTKPTIRTYNTATSSTTIITAPSGYQSSVVSTYDGKEYHTVATSTPLTAQDIQKMQDNMRAQQEAMNRMFQAQQALFDEQNRMFETMMNGAFPDLAPVSPTPKKASTNTTKKNVPSVTPPHIVATSTGTTTPMQPAVSSAENKPSFFQRFLHFFGL